MFIAALFIIIRTRKQPKYHKMEEWIWYIYTMEYYTEEPKTLVMNSEKGSINREAVLTS